MKKKVLSMLVLLAAVVTGAVAQTTYKVSVKEGTDDATSWQGKAGTGEYQDLPLESVAAGTAVSVKYNGTKKVKSVKAKKKAAAEPAGPTTVTWDFSQLSGAALTPYENGGVTLSGGGFLDFDDNSLTCFDELTFTAPSGKKFTSIVITASDWFEFYGTGWSGSTWSDSDGQTTINFTGGAGGISTIVFTLVAASAEPEPAVPTLADVFTDGAVVGVAVKNTYDTYTVTGTYSGGSYTSYTKSSNDIEEVTMTKDGNNLVVWIKGDTNSECTLTFNTQDNTYTKSFKAGTGAAVWDLSEFVSISVNGTDITSSLEDVTPAAAETTITWTSSDMPSNFYANFDDGWTNNNTHQGITVTASGSAQGGWSQNQIDVNEGSGTITFTSSVGNIKSIVITADNMNNIDEWHVPTGWTINNPWDNPRTLSWNGTASTTVNLPLSNGQNISEISTIVFTLE